MAELDPTWNAGSDGLSLCAPVLESVRCRECGTRASAHPHSPMALTNCCIRHVPRSPQELRCPHTCFSQN